MRERRAGRRCDVLGAQSQVLDLHRGGAHQDVVAMQDAFRFAGRTGGEEQLCQRGRRGAAGVERLGVHLDLRERRLKAQPIHRFVRVVRGRQRLAPSPSRRHDDVLEPERKVAAEDRRFG